VSCQTRRFQKTSRLTKSLDFQKVFRSSFRSVDNKFLVLAQRNGLVIARLGLAISKRRINKAVERNRVKRLIRESFRHQKIDLGGLDVVVIAQKNISFKDGDITKSLSIHWEQVLNCEK